MVTHTVLNVAAGLLVFTGGDVAARKGGDSGDDNLQGGLYYRLLVARSFYAFYHVASTFFFLFRV